MFSTWKNVLALFIDLFSFKKKTTVEDVNDNPPQFEQRSYRCVLSEDGKRGQFVTMVTATDPDVSDQTRLVYSLTGGNDLQMFNIDSKRGIIDSIKLK